MHAPLLPPPSASTSTVTQGCHTNIPTTRALIPPASCLLARAFVNDPVITYALSTLPKQERDAYLPEYFTALLTAATLNCASIDYVEGAPEGSSGDDGAHDADGKMPEGLASSEWKSVGVLMPPGKRVDNPWTLLQAGLLGATWKVGLRGAVRMLYEFPSHLEPAKKKGLKGQTSFYYVFFMATHPLAESQGHCSAIMRSYQSRAADALLPIWLEATTEKSRDVYLHLGWVVVEEMVLGKGQAGADGEPKMDGEGARMWAMVWWPPSSSDTGTGT